MAGFVNAVGIFQQSLDALLARSGFSGLFDAHVRNHASVMCASDLSSAGSAG